MPHWHGRLGPDHADQAVITQELKRALIDPESAVRLTAIENSDTIFWGLLEEHAPPQISPELEQLLMDEDPSVRFASARVLIKRGNFDQSDIDLLLEGLGSKRPETFESDDARQLASRERETRREIRRH